MLKWIDENIGRTPFITMAGAAFVSFLIVIFAIQCRRAWVGLIIVPAALTPFLIGLWYTIRIVFAFLMAAAQWANPPGAPRPEVEPFASLELVVFGPLAGILLSMPSLVITIAVATARNCEASRLRQRR